jgi:hypothetical protein
MRGEKAKQYLEKRGMICPFCGSHDIEGGSMDFEAGEIVQSISCHDCGERWVDVYKLVAVADAESGDIIASIAFPAK